MKMIIEDDILRELYETERMNMTDIANAMGVSATTVKNKMMKANIQIRHDTQFKQKRREFSLDNFNDGYIDNHGRFRVWKPEHERAYNEGYILRAIVAYEEYNNEIVTKDYDIHHIDGNKLNDKKENLMKIKHGKHTTLHSYKKETHIKRICKTCGNEFEIEKWRLNDNTKRGKYCSTTCLHNRRKTT